MNDLVAVVVDDDTDRAVMKMRLEEIGYRVDAVAEPAGLNNAEYQLALVDMVYDGDANGPSFCRSIHEKWPQCLIIAVSGVDEREGFFLQAMQEGACAQLDKMHLTAQTLNSVIQVHWCRWHAGKK